MTIRFDADEDKVVRGAHSYDKSERDGWGGDEETLWYLTDGNSNGRWLYIDKPDPGGRGRAEVGIARVYRKHLSPAALRSFAAALLEAAEEGEAIQARIKTEDDARRQREADCAADGGHQWGPAPMTVTHATGTWSPDTGILQEFEVCARCGRGEWHSRPWDPIAEARQRIAERGEA